MVAGPAAGEPEPEPSAAAATAAPVASTAAPTAAGPRVWARSHPTWIWPKPDASGVFLGYVRVGTSVALRSGERVKGLGCSAGFWAIEPRGYVCASSATTEPEPWLVAAGEATAAAPGAFPYRWAISDGAPMYNRVPTAAEQDRFERRYGPRGKALKLPKTLRSHEELATTAPVAPADEVPAFLLPGPAQKPRPLGLLRQSIPLGSRLSFTRAFTVEGRTFLLSVDETIVPADRTRVFTPSAFRGVRPEGEAALPIAWTRVGPKPKHRRSEGGAIQPTGTSWPVRTWVGLVDPVTAVESGGVRYLETRERDDTGPLFIAEPDATVVDVEPKIPPGVKPDQKWMLVRITKGTLVAYEGKKPVYATLVSPGVGGIAVKGQDPVKASTTPLGTYYVTFKDRAATMSPDAGKPIDERTLWLADVPFTQYFDPPFAIHGAYWHERFGELVSAGCVNVSPTDGEALFDWSDPQVPRGWQGATGSGAKENGGTTAVVVWR